MIAKLFLENLSLWSCFWQSTLFAFIGLAGSWFLRRRPSRACQVLFLSMSAAVIVPVLSGLVKHYELGMLTSETVPSPVRTNNTVTSYESDRYMVSSPTQGVSRIPVEEGQIPHISSENMTYDSSHRIEWLSIIVSGWMLMTSILLMRLMYSCISSIHILCIAKSENCEQIRMAADIAGKKLGITVNLQIRRSVEVKSPMIWCWSSNPVLLVSEKSGDNIDWAAVICHELAHFKRADHITGLIAEIIVCLLPWNPFLWLSKRIMIRLSEQACDDWVIAAGQAPEDYAQSLLNFKPQGQRSFAPAVVHSKKGLSQRIRRILTENCFYPRTGKVWLVTTFIIALCITIGVAFAQSRPAKQENIYAGIAGYESLPSPYELIRKARTGETESSIAETPKPERIIHFPKDRSLGKLYICDINKYERFCYWFHWAWVEFGDYFCEAKGDISVPAGTKLILTSSFNDIRDFSPLSDLRPDDLYGINISMSPGDAPSADVSDKAMLYITKLTGLKFLFLYTTNITDKGMKNIINLKSLEVLHLPDPATDISMAYVGELISLKKLFLKESGSLITDAGLKHVAKLKNLEEICLCGNDMGDNGLVYIKDLPKLEYLCIKGKNFSDRGMVHIKNMKSLKMLSFHEDLSYISDAGLADISEIPNLEYLCLHAMKNITDKGIAHLTKMRSLKQLHIESAKITDKGLLSLSRIKTLEHLELPGPLNGITDTGVSSLGTLPNLKSLKINQPLRAEDYYTDKSLEALANCKKLEKLGIGSPGITDVGLSYVAKLPNLNELLLFNCDNITNEGLANMTESKSLRSFRIFGAKNVTVAGVNKLNSLKNLTKLEIKEIKSKDTILDISELTNLEFLHLGSRYLKDEKFTDVDLKCLANHKKLNTLFLFPRDFTDKGMVTMSNMTNMRSLSIYGSDLTDEGLKYLTNLKKLEELSIVSSISSDTGGNITEKGLRYLEEIKSLKVLDICTDNDLSDTALRRLFIKLPDLVILRINGAKLQETNLNK